MLSVRVEAEERRRIQHGHSRAKGQTAETARAAHRRHQPSNRHNGYANNNSSALEEVFGERHIALLKLASMITGNADDARDVVQDVYEAVAKNYADRTRKELEAIVFTSTRNRALSYLKRSRWVAQTEDDVIDYVAEWSSSDNKVSPEQAAIAKDQLNCVHAIISSMPPRRIKVFLLHRLKGMSFVEISKTLGISESTVLRDVAAAIDELTKRMPR